MGYIKHAFQNGEVLTAEELNEMDDGIYNNDLNIASLTQQKVDKVPSAISDNIAKFNSTGNLVDSGISSLPPLDTGEYYLIANRTSQSVEYNWEVRPSYNDIGNGNIRII